MKVAILGGGICGLACALELERDAYTGWAWPSVTF